MTTSLPSQYNSVIADPDVSTRMRLKQATSSVVQFGEVVQSSSLQDAMNRLQNGQRWDVIFLSHRYEQAEVSRFVREAKLTKSGEDAAFIMVLKSKDQHNGTVAQQMMLGADGFLFEPYSVDLLVEITDLAARIKRERSDAREKIALTLMISDLMTQIDLVAFLKSHQADSGRSMARLQEMSAELKKIPPESLGNYLEIAIKMFSESPPPKAMFQSKSYSGASSRVKKLMEQKLLVDVQKLQEQERARLSSSHEVQPKPQKT